MSRWPCKPKGSCVPDIQPTIVHTIVGSWRYWYCTVCRHAVRSEPIPPPRPRGGGERKIA